MSAMPLVDEEECTTPDCLRPVTKRDVNRLPFCAECYRDLCLDQERLEDPDAE